MQLNDTVPERRNLIVFCMTTIAFHVGGGSFSEGVKMPILGVEFTNTTGLLILYVAVFIYLTARYLLVVQSAPYVSEGEEYNYGYQVTKNYKTAASSVFIKYIQPTKKLCKLLQWKTNSTNDFASFQSKFDEYLANESFEEGRLGFDSEEVSGSKGYKTIYMLYRSQEQGKSLRSNNFSPLSFRYFLIMMPAIVMNVYKDKYLLNWYFPFLLLGVSIILFVYSLFVHLYG